MAALAPEAARREALRVLSEQLDQLVLNLPPFGELSLRARVHEHQIASVEIGATISRKIGGRPC